MGGKGKGGKGGKASEKGKGKGGSGKGGKGKDTKGKTKAVDSLQPPSAKTVQELEAELLKKGSKSRVDARGVHCQVRKHTDMGCAVVTMESEAAREAVLEHAASKTPAKEDKKDRPEVQVGDYSIQMRRHYDKTNQVQVKTDIFVAWGRQNERRSPLSATTLAETFDGLLRDANPAAAAQGQANAMQAAVPSPYLTSVLGAGQTGAAMMPGYMPMHPQQYGMPMAAQWHSQMAQWASMVAAHAAQAHQAQQAAQQAQQHLLAQQQRQQQQQQTQTQQTESGAQPDPAKNDGEAYSGGVDNSGYLATPERKAMSIIDPKSGEPIKFDLHKVTANRPLSIIDPSSGSPVDTTDMNSTPEEATKLETPAPESNDSGTVETPVETPVETQGTS